MVLNVAWYMVFAPWARVVRKVALEVTSRETFAEIDILMINDAVMFTLVVMLARHWAWSIRFSSYEMNGHIIKRVMRTATILKGLKRSTVSSMLWNQIWNLKSGRVKVEVDCIADDDVIVPVTRPTDRASQMDVVIKSDRAKCKFLWHLMTVTKLCDKSTVWCPILGSIVVVLSPKYSIAPL